jgi:hypothetical protein
MISSFSGTIGTSVSAEMHDFYIYEKVAAHDLGWIQVFSHLATRRIREILYSVKFASPQDRSIFTHALLTRPAGNALFSFFKIRR